MGCCYSKEVNPNLVSERTRLLQSMLPDGSPIKEGTRDHARAVAGLAEVKCAENGNKLIPVDTTSNITSEDLATSLAPLEKHSSSVQDGISVLTESLVGDSSLSKPTSMCEKGKDSSKSRNLEKNAKDIKLVRPQIKPCTERVMSNSVKRRIAENAAMRANWFKELTPSGTSNISDTTSKTLTGRSPYQISMLNSEVHSNDASKLPGNANASKNVFTVTTEALPTGIGKSADSSTVSAYISRSQVSDVGENDDGNRKTGVALEEDFRTQTKCFYSICSIDADDLEIECEQTSLDCASNAMDVDVGPLNVTVGGEISSSVLECQLATSCPVKEALSSDSQTGSEVLTEHSGTQCPKHALLRSKSHIDDPILPDLLQMSVPKETVCKSPVCEVEDKLPPHGILNETVTDLQEVENGHGSSDVSDVTDVTVELTPDLLEGKGQVSKLAGEESRQGTEESGLRSVNQHGLPCVYEVSGYEHKRQPQPTSQLNEQFDNVYTAHVSESTHLQVKSVLEDDHSGELSTCPDELVCDGFEGASEIPTKSSPVDDMSEYFHTDIFAGSGGIVPKADVQISKTESEIPAKQPEDDSSNKSIIIEHMADTPQLVGRPSGVEAGPGQHGLKTLEEYPKNVSLMTDWSATAHSQLTELESAYENLSDDTVEELISVKLKQYEKSEPCWGSTNAGPSVLLENDVHSQDYVCDEINEIPESSLPVVVAEKMSESSAVIEPNILTVSCAPSTEIQCAVVQEEIPGDQMEHISDSMQMNDFNWSMCSTPESSASTDYMCVSEALREEDHLSMPVPISTSQAEVVEAQCEMHCRESSAGEDRYATSESVEMESTVNLNMTIPAIVEEHSEHCVDVSSRVTSDLSSSTEEFSDSFSGNEPLHTDPVYEEHVIAEYLLSRDFSSPPKKIVSMGIEEPLILNQSSNQQEQIESSPGEAQECTEKGSDETFVINYPSLSEEGGHSMGLNASLSVFLPKTVASEQPQVAALGRPLAEGAPVSLLCADDEGKNLENSVHACILPMSGMPELSAIAERMYLSDDSTQGDRFLFSVPDSESSEVSEVTPYKMLSQGTLGVKEAAVLEGEHGTLPVRSVIVQQDKQWLTNFDATSENPQANILSGPLLAMCSESPDPCGPKMQTDFDVSGALEEDVTTSSLDQPIALDVEPDQVDANATLPSYEIHLTDGKPLAVPSDNMASTEEADGEQGMLNLVCDLLEKCDFNGDATDASQYLSAWSQESHETICSDPTSEYVLDPAWEYGFCNMAPCEDGEDASKDNLQGFQTFMATHPCNLLALDGTCVWDWQSDNLDLVSIGYPVTLQPFFLNTGVSERFCSILWCDL